MLPVAVLPPKPPAVPPIGDGRSEEFSLLQIGLEAETERSGRQTAEAGWQEFQDKYGDWIPHLFVYYTTNGYSKNCDNPGGYNQEVKGWIQYSALAQMTEEVLLVLEHLIQTTIQRVLFY